MIGSAAIAIFVKTPGLSPIKTRLQDSAGRDVAREFYLRGLAITEAVVARTVLGGAVVTPYWAVAEEDGIPDSRWQSFATLWQGEGDLGARMARVYAELLKLHPIVLLTGADIPLLTPGHLEEALHRLAVGSHPFALGRALDGGFYLFGGTAPVPLAAWRAVKYGDQRTADQLLTALSPLGGVAELPPLSDVDTAEDLLALPGQSSPAEDLLPSQWSLLQWISELRVPLRGG